MLELTTAAAGGAAAAAGAASAGVAAFDRVRVSSPVRKRSGQHKQSSFVVHGKVIAKDNNISNGNIMRNTHDTAAVTAMTITKANQPQHAQKEGTEARKGASRNANVSAASMTHAINLKSLIIPTERGVAPKPSVTLEAPLVDSCQHLLKPNGSILGREVAKTVLPCFPNLLSAWPRTADPQRPALSCIDGRVSVTHDELLSFIQQTGNRLHDMGVGRGFRVGLVLPNGPELAAAILAVSAWACCVPLSATSATQELEADLQAAAIDLVMGLDPDDQDAACGRIPLTATKLGIPFCGMRPDSEKAGVFDLVPPPVGAPPVVCRRLLAGEGDGSTISTYSSAAASVATTRRVGHNTHTSEADRSAGDISPSFWSNQKNNKMGFEDYDEEAPAAAAQEQYDAEVANTTTACQAPNGHEDEVLVLFTSGTTGSKKLVPHVMADLMVATACIAVSWQLSADDTNCNLMPLFHVGGIIRQVYSPVLSGGCVICCPSFDPAIFWQLLFQKAFTWYYAAPTMHQVLLQTGKDEGYLPAASANKKHARRKSPFPLRMIANAAGGLLPSLARELRQAFSCNVLPSYGMTECMPITSPPASYQLEKPGTSGVAVGPEIAILDLDTLRPVEAGKEGPICVRGEPCFRGYGVIYGPVAAQDGDEEKGSNSYANDCPMAVSATAPPAASFLPNGWFNTGDLGYMDSDGYLYITGRSKEIINRGGEIISPLEVEEAVNGHPDVLACVAFSTQHSVLQEVVGLVVVLNKNKPRKLDLPALHAYLQGRLAAPKWPQLLVYMDALPKSRTNKLLRVKLGKRLSLPEIHDHMYCIERTFSAKCPAQGTAVSVAIPSKRVAVNARHVQAELRQALITDPSRQDLVVEQHASKIGHLVAHVYNLDRLTVVRVAQQVLDAYAVPSHVCLLSSMVTTMNAAGFVRTDPYCLAAPRSSDAIAAILQQQDLPRGPTDPIVRRIQELFSEQLDLDCLPAPTSNFFNLGGSSMLASQLASKVRKEYGVPLGGAEIFHHADCDAIASVIRERQEDNGSGSGGGGSSSNNSSGSTDPASKAASSLFGKSLDFRETPFEATRLKATPASSTTLFQMVPLLLILPAWQLTRFFLFFRLLLLTLSRVPASHNIVIFVLTLVLFHLIWITVTPICFVIVKWTVIGSYKQGRYAIWSEYYLRWWLVDVLRKLIGRGIWGCHEVTLNFYYRLLGAKIGRFARISLEAELAEFDLVTIGEGAAVEYCTVRAFGVDNGAMILGPVKVGAAASVGARSVVAPFTTIPPGAHLGPVTSSYELNVYDSDMASDFGGNPKHLRYNRQALPEPSLLWQFLVVAPITFAVDTFSHLPALAVLYALVKMPWHKHKAFASVGDLMEWLCDPRRIPFYIGIRVARAVLAPVFYMTASVIVKWLIIGKFQPGPRTCASEWQLCRHSLASTLFSRENMQDFCEVIGRHYELVSGLYRMLGAKVGKRVFWPGHQPVFTGEFDLLEIGDDVVFGSRSSIFCTTQDGAEPVRLCAGSNVSDNTVVLPGSVVGKNAVLGSNSVCPAGAYLPEASVWFGARGGEPVLLEKGVEDVSSVQAAAGVDEAQLSFEGDDSTLRPFGRAFSGEASYYVFSLWIMILFTAVTKTIICALHTFPILAALHLTAWHFYGWPASYRNYDSVRVSFLGLFAAMLFFLILAHAVRCAIWCLIELAAKWCLMGRRQEGRYNWDSSSYNQNWEMYQIISKVRNFGRLNFLDFLSGTPALVQFFRWQGCVIGENCCLYPAGGDPYLPEPDLVTFGDSCVVDCASVVCHLNTRGNFELVSVHMEDNVTLRTRSRIQQGVYMERGSMLLEKSLAMTGEVVEAGTVWQGAPAARVFSYDQLGGASANPSEEDTGGVRRQRPGDEPDNVFV